MEISEEVKTLSKRKQRLSLGESAKRKKQRDKEGKRTPARTCVIRPNDIQWPTYDTNWRLEFTTILGRLLEPMKMPNRKVPLNEIRKVESAERRAFRRKWMLEECDKTGFKISTYFTLRACLAFGVNCVSKSLERDILVGVIIDTAVKPEMITKLLIPIAIGKNVPIVAIHGLNSIFKSSCAMRCIAVGFKRQCSESSNHFFQIVELINSANSFRVQISTQSNASTSSKSVKQKPGSVKGTPTTGKPSDNEDKKLRKKRVRKLGF